MRQRCFLPKEVAVFLLLNLMEGTRQQLPGDRRDGVTGCCWRSRSGKRLPVLVAQLLHLQLTHEVEHAEVPVFLPDRHGSMEDAAASLAVAVLDVRQDSQQCFENLSCLLEALFLDAFPKDVACRPEHAERRVMPLMHGIHRAYCFVGFLYSALLPQVENFLYRHNV